MELLSLSYAPNNERAKNANASNRHMRIDIVSDVVCPWCAIGYKQLERALEAANTSADIHWHPYELNPTMGPEGENLLDHVAAKYGTTPEGSVETQARIIALGVELGFEFNYSSDMRIVNTFRAHQIAHWAGTQAQAHDVMLAFFSAFFTHRRDLNDPLVLADCAATVGLDPELAVVVLQEGRYAQDVREAEYYWVSHGIQGVPVFIIDEKTALVGAQGIEKFSSVLASV